MCLHIKYFRYATIWTLFTYTSASRRQLIVPRVPRSTFGARAFAIAAQQFGILCLTVCVIQLLGLISFDMT